MCTSKLRLDRKPMRPPLAIFGVSTLCGNVTKYSHPLQQAFFFKQMVECHKVSKKKKKKQTVSAVLRFLPFHARAHKSSACNAWTAAALRLIWRMLPPRITLAAIVLFIPQCQCLTSDGNARFNYLSFFSLWDVDCIYDLSFSCVFLTVSMPWHWYWSGFLPHMLNITVEVLWHLLRE